MNHSSEANSSRLDTMLILPPQWTPLCIYYALPLLAGEIKNAGFSCKIRDLNIEYFNHCLTPKYLSWCRTGAEERQSALSMDFIMNIAERGATAASDNNNEMLLLEGKIEQAENYWDAVIHKIEEAKQVLRDPEAFYDPYQLQHAFEMIVKGLEIASLPFYPAQIMLRDFRNRKTKMTLDALTEAVDNEAENPFADYYRQVLPSIQAENPMVIGISINAHSQILAGLTLAKMLKESMPDTHITIGGNFFTRVTDALLGKPQFFEQFCHTLMVAEGEKPFVALLETIKSGRNDFASVPNLLYPQDGQVLQNPEGCSKPLDEIADPDLEGVDLSAYLAPEMVMPIQASRGCYWKKCTFCDHDFGANFNLKSLDKLVREIKVLRDRYGVRQFEFIDESISPAYLKRMAQRFIDEDLNIRFFMYARTEKAFTQEILDLAHRAGCRMIMWGVESGSERVMKLIEKGVPLETRFEPLQMANNAGIWNFCFTFFGFPTETKEEAMQTIRMIMAHKDIINSYGMSHFTLGKHTRIKDDPARFSIQNIREDEEELSTRLNYDITEGMTRDEVNKVTDLCTEICNQIYRAPLWFSIGFREFLHLYLDRYGLDYCKRFSYIDDETDEADVYQYQAG